MRIKIEVTEQDIKSGKPLSVSSGPTAKAIRRALGLKRGVEADGNAIFISGYEMVPTPKNISSFITKFDLDGKKAVKPQAFTLSLKKAAAANAAV